jgi:hypothetical protein
MQEYRVMVNNAEQTDEPQVSRVTDDRQLFDRWWTKAESFAMNRGLYAVGQYREQGSTWKTLVEIES